MPKKGQTRELPKDLRDVVRSNLDGLLEAHGWSAAKAAKEAGVGASSVKRALLPSSHPDSSALNLDTLQALAKAFDVQPWVLLMKDGAVKVGKIFSTPAPDAKLGSKWTRPDRPPLLQSDHGKYSVKKARLKTRQS